MDLGTHIILAADTADGDILYYKVDEQTLHAGWTYEFPEAKRFDSDEKALLALSDATSTPVLSSQIVVESANLYHVYCTAKPFTDAEILTIRTKIGR